MAYRIEKINGAAYVVGKPKNTELVSICFYCAAKDRCAEPEKERRISCTTETLKKNGIEGVLP